MDSIDFISTIVLEHTKRFFRTPSTLLQSWCYGLQYDTGAFRSIVRVMIGLYVWVRGLRPVIWRWLISFLSTSEARLGKYTSFGTGWLPSRSTKWSYRLVVWWWTANGRSRPLTMPYSTGVPSHCHFGTVVCGCKLVIIDPMRLIHRYLVNEAQSFQVFEHPKPPVVWCDPASIPLYHTNCWNVAHLAPVNKYSKCQYVLPLAIA